MHRRNFASLMQTSERPVLEIAPGASSTTESKIITTSYYQSRVSAAARVSIGYITVQPVPSALSEWGGYILSPEILFPCHITKEQSFALSATSVKNCDKWMPRFVQRSIICSYSPIIGPLKWSAGSHNPTPREALPYRKGTKEGNSSGKTNEILCKVLMT